MWREVREVCVERGEGGVCGEGKVREVWVCGEGKVREVWVCVERGEGGVCGER